MITKRIEQEIERSDVVKYIIDRGLTGEEFDSTVATSVLVGSGDSTVVAVAVAVAIYLLRFEDPGYYV